MANRKLIIITSREPLNTEGNSHMHYVNELTRHCDVLFVNPPLSWPPKASKYSQLDESLWEFGYFNFLPYRFIPRISAWVNDYLTSRKLKKIIGQRDFILWQFDPYYLNELGGLKPEKIVYFPLDYYGRDFRDPKFAKRADLLVTVNQLFLKRSYNHLNQNIFLIPHGYSDVQYIKPDQKWRAAKVKEEFGDYFIFTGTLNKWLNYSLMEKVARQIHPKKLLLVGRQLVPDQLLAELTKMDNVVFLGHKPYTELKYFVHNALACLVFYDFETEGSRNPIKITDYFAQSKVVINPLGLEGYSAFESKGLYTAKNEEEYLNLVSQAERGELAVDVEFVEQWRKTYSYSSLVRMILKKIKIKLDESLRS